MGRNKVSERLGTRRKYGEKQKKERMWLKQDRKIGSVVGVASDLDIPKKLLMIQPMRLELSR